MNSFCDSCDGECAEIAIMVVYGIENYICCDCRRIGDLDYCAPCKDQWEYIPNEPDEEA